MGCKEDPAAAAGEDRESWSEVFVLTREAEAEVEARVEFHFPLHKQRTTHNAHTRHRHGSARVAVL